MLRPGTVLGDRYALLEPVARGGMGEVWRANDTVLGRIIAVKVLLPVLAGDPGFAERFRTEARAMASLSDPNIVEVYDYGQAGGLAYLVMPFVPGESLHALLRRVGPLPPSRAMTLVAQAARALHQAHGQGIVHRDVKPGNLLIRPDGRLVLTDFGIARIVAADGLTGSGEIVGTASYLAPEQVTGGPVGPAADVYALGVVAYECLTLTPPFVADTPVTVALMHTNQEPPPLPAALPEPVRRVVLRALAKDPGQRWSSAEAMAKAASAAAAASEGVRALRGARPSRARPAPTASRLTASRSVPPAPRPPTQPAGPPRRRRAVWAAAALLLLAVLGWVALRGGLGDGTGTAAPPSSAPADAHLGQSTLAAVPTPTGAPTAAPTTAAAGAPTARATTRPPTRPPSPGPGQSLVPDVYGRYEIEADYMIRAAGLVPEFTYVTSQTQCSVVAQTPGPNTVVAVNTTVRMTVARTSDTCQPV